jgi:hypothetical protein
MPRCVVLASSLLLVGCGGGSESLCDSPLSVPSYTMRFSQGLDNFSEDQYQQLRLDSLEVLDTINAVAVSSAAPSEASKLAIKVNTFVGAMDDADWDVSIALLTNEAVEAASVLGTVETLSQANAIDAFVISQCGLPSTLAPIVGPADTLPSPSIPSPTQTDPPVSPPNDESEAREAGRLVASVYNLTLSDNDMVCLGSELSDIVDVSGANANLAQYQGQFQKAFDACNINFSVPVE